MRAMCDNDKAICNPGGFLDGADQARKVKTYPRLSADEKCIADPILQKSCLQAGQKYLATQEHPFLQIQTFR